jgi:hypothetical protein
MMTRAKDVQSVRARAVLIAGLLALSGGCGLSNPKAIVTPQAQPSAPALSVGPQQPVEPSDPAIPVASLSAAKAQAEAFLKLLPSNVEAASQKIAIAFKKQVTGSLTYEDEKKLGYSESDTQKYLKQVSAGVTKWELRTSMGAPNGIEFSFRGEATTPSGPMLFAVRLANAGDAWQVTRFAVSKVAAGEAARSIGSFEQLWVRETALDFLDVLFGGDPDHTLTMTAMTEAFKKRISDKFPADAGLAYSKRGVRQWLNDMRKGTNGYEITSHSDDTKGPSFSGQLIGKPGKFTLWAVKDADGNWKVDDFVLQ